MTRYGLRVTNLLDLISNFWRIKSLKNKSVMENNYSEGIKNNIDESSSAFHAPTLDVAHQWQDGGGRLSTVQEGMAQKCSGGRPTLHLLRQHRVDERVEFQRNLCEKHH